ncbi:MAG: hypothetical protein QXU18_04860 [Thermoplasmatales archaeon]
MGKERDRIYFWNIHLTEDKKIEEKIQSPWESFSDILYKRGYKSYLENDP